MKRLLLTSLAAIAFISNLYAQNNLNQTPDVSPVLTGCELPFSVEIEQADFSLPNGLHSGATAVYNDKWLYIAGRTNGMHGFNNDDNNFPPQQQNTSIYVIDLNTETVYSKSMTDASSGLTQEQIDSLVCDKPPVLSEGFYSVYNRRLWR